MTVKGLSCVCTGLGILHSCLLLPIRPFEKVYSAKKEILEFANSVDPDEAAPL